jgi:hypothetical protein
MTVISSLNVLAIASMLSVSAWAQSPTTSSCTRAEHRQFDFWIGEWDVTLPNGTRAGVNRIRAINGGCALQEDWTGARGATGTSLNAFDASTTRWHQTWVGSDGLVLFLDGGLRDGAMELSGTTTGPPGTTTRHRIRWTPLGGTPATVRQLWESSSDHGKSWTVAFDGLYRKRV